MGLRKIAIALCLTVFLTPFTAKAKKEPETGLKKIIAIGYVDTGYLGFQNMEPEELSEMFRIEIKKALAKRGYAPVLAQMGAAAAPAPATAPTEVPQMPEMPQSGKPMSPQEMQKVVAQMQQIQQQMMSQMHGYQRPSHEPVAAQALFHFQLRTGESSLDTGEAVGWAEFFSQQPLGLAEVSSETTKIYVLTTQHDPESGKLMDNHATKASSTRFHRLGGYTYYSISDSANHAAAFERVFRSSVEKVAKWIDEKMKRRDWEGQIFKQEGSKVYLNAGKEAGVNSGMRFQVLKTQSLQGRGVDLGVEKIAIGEIQIDQVQDKFSTGTLISGQAPVGSLVKTLPAN